MGDLQPRTRVAVVHAASVFLDREGSIAKACDLVAEAARGGARLIAFPETFVPGYPYWVWTHTPPAGAALFRELYLNSVEVPSPATDALGEASRKSRAYVVIGVSERESGTLYNTLLYFDDQGALIGRHRKLQPTQAERMVWGRGDARDLFVLSTPHGRLGGLICFEHTMDLARYALTTMGEQIHVAAWPAISAITHDPVSQFFDSISEAAAKHHALAGQTFVLNAQPCLDEATVDRLGFAGRPEMLRTGGGWSAVIGPHGQVIAGPTRDEETILYADIDLADIITMKQPCDSAGHYARPDVFFFGLRPPAPLPTECKQASSGETPPDPVPASDQDLSAAS